ncbi:MAG: hypothetical protein FWE42_03520 [Defluviitaleaceae bacterium]|nr:hypothetical protein [Defluviitaleaceae bacterium]
MYKFTAEVKAQAHAGVEKYLGSKADIFLTNAEAIINKYISKWQLSNLSYMPTNTINMLFSCESAQYGQCVLKICIPGPEVATEINCIRAYDGMGYVKLWDYNMADNVLLLERITPGTQMWAVEDYKQRAQLMGRRIKDLPFIKCSQGQYPTYKTWLEGIHKKLTPMSGMDDIIFYLNEGLRIYARLKEKYNRSALLHGDMHQENLLLNPLGGYTIIDPKGVTDDPIMETARFLINEIPCKPEKIKNMVSIMAPIIGVGEADVLKSMYIDAALCQSWTMEEYFPTQEAFNNSKHEVLETCNFVYRLLEM